MLKQCCRRGEPSAGLRPARGSLQLGRRFFVGSDGGYCEVPCAAIGIDFTICRSGERQVGCTPIVLRRSRVRRGSHEWVVKTHRRTDLEQLRVAGRGRRVRSDVQRPRRAPEEACIPCRIRGSQQHQLPCRSRKRVDPSSIVLLDLTGDGCRGWDTETAGEFGARHCLREFEQTQWITARLGDDPITHLLIEVTGDDVAEQRARVLVGEPLECQVGEAVEQAVLSDFPYREDQQHRFGQKPAPDEFERVARCLVEPLRIVDQAHERFFVGGFRQQAQRRETDDEPVRSASSPQPEGNLQRVCLRFRERVPYSEHRRTQLMQRGERQLELRLEARDLRDSALSGPAGAIPEQRGFADSRLSANDERRTPAATNVGEEPVEHVPLT